MTIDANLIEGFKIGMGFGFVLGFIMGIVTHIMYVRAKDDD